MSLANTLMLAYRSDYTNQFDKNELRKTNPGALNAFMAQTASDPLFDQQTMANIKASYGNVVEVPVMDAETVTVGTPYVRTCNIVDDENDSAIVTLVFQSYGWAFSMTPDTHYNNEVKYEQDFIRKMRKYRIEWDKTLDAACIAQLETDKNQVFGNIPQYANVGDALQVPAAETTDFYNQAEVIMDQIDFGGNVDIINSTNHTAFVRRYQNQSDGNAVNDAFQFDLRGYRWFPTNRLVNAVGVTSSGFLVQNGTLFIDNRNDAGTTVGYNILGGGKVWDTEAMPTGMGSMEMGTFFQEDCADRSAVGGAPTAGNTRSVVQGFEFSTDIVLATAYNSDIATRENPIVKFEFLP